MKLYGYGATRSLRVQWVFNELGLEYEFVPVKLKEGEHHSPAFLQLNPAHKVPVLVDGDAVITESAAIALYLAEKYPDKGLLPTDVAQRGQVYRWLMFAMTELEQPLWRMARHNFLYPEDKRLPGDIELAKADFRDMARVLEQHMIGRVFVVGDRLTVADCVIVYVLDWASLVGLMDGLPQLSAYLERLCARPTAPLRMAAALAA